MTMEDTVHVQDPQPEGAPAAPEAEAMSAARDARAPRSHWDQVLAAMQERS